MNHFRPIPLLRVGVLAALWASLSVSGLRADVIISEFMAANTRTLPDEEGHFSDWIELHNAGAAAVNLEGWHLTDSASTLVKWKLPAVTLQPGEHLVVFASNKNRRDPSRPLHTNFALSASGEYLGLVQPDGVTVAFDFGSSYPAQPDDQSFGVVRQADGSWAHGPLRTASPSAPNAALLPAVLTEQVQFSRAPGLFHASFALELAGAAPGQQIRFIAGATLEAVTSAPVDSWALYSTPVLISSSTLIRAVVISADGQMQGPVAQTYFMKVGADLGGFSSQLPVSVLDTLGSGPLRKDELDHPAWLHVFGAAAEQPVFATSPELVSFMSTSVRGSSSADFPKKGYNAKFLDPAGKERAEGLLGLPAHERWALVAPWSLDLGYINNAFMYELSNQLGRWAPRTRLVEMFVNDDGNDVERRDYAGIYVVTDRIEVAPERANLGKLGAKDTGGEEVTGGYLLKLDPKDADEIGWRTERGVPTDGVASLILVSPKATDVQPAQLSYIQRYVQEMEDALHADHAAGFTRRTHLDYIDRAAWVDHHILNTFSANPDALTRSAYFSKPRGGRLAAGPIWDFDRALGSHWDERSKRWDRWSSPDMPDVWHNGWWRLLVQDPEFMQEWIDRWHFLRGTTLSDGNMAQMIEGLAQTIGTAAAARDAARWPDIAPVLGSHSAQIVYLRDWMINRATWIDQQFLAPPAVSRQGEQLTLTPAPGTSVAYTLDGSDPRSLGGKLAPNALLTSTPLTVSSATNLQARSYRPEPAAVFPATPWSAAVGGPASSPLRPAARLVNLSSRAMVGGGEQALITGVVISDTTAKRYLARGVGPGLGAFGATNFIPDPQITVFSSSGKELQRNAGWQQGKEAQHLSRYARDVGAFPLGAGSLDAALTNEVSAGSYTLQITSPTQRNGIGLAELYEMDLCGRTLNLSTRAFVRTGEGVLIGGFVVTGPAHMRMLIRAVGPTLKSFGVGSALSDPVLTLYAGQNVVATNDRWDAVARPAAVEAATSSAGAFALPPASEDAALLITLPPGAYTVELRGKSAEEGVALLEIYTLP